MNIVAKMVFFFQILKPSIEIKQKLGNFWENTDVTLWLDLVPESVNTSITGP